MKNKKIIISGGRGFIAQQLAARWSAHNEVILLTRGNAQADLSNRYQELEKQSRLRYIQWDGKTTDPSWTAALEGADLLVNLAGRSVNTRYSEKNKLAILNSRIDSTRVLGQAVAACQQPPALWINASSATIYPHSVNMPNGEEAAISLDNHQPWRRSSYESTYNNQQPINNNTTGASMLQDGLSNNFDFSVQVCLLWEKAFFEAPATACRKLALRTAITLGKGGILTPFERMVRLGFGGPQDNGKQMFSWIHIEDLARIMEFCLDHPEISGIVNAAAPCPLENRIFMQQLRKALHCPFGLPMPRWLLNGGARLIGTETELLLKSRYVIPEKLNRAGFIFNYPTIDSALKAIYGKPGQRQNIVHNHSDE